MHLSGVDLNLFVVFETIYAQRNLTRTSEILNITQPAVSNALARLRAAMMIRCLSGLAGQWRRAPWRII